MTNEEFLFKLATYIIDVSMARIYYASSHIDQDMNNHARKLVALSEAANAVYSSAAQTTPDAIWEVDDEEMQWLGRALKELQGTPSETSDEGDK